MAWAGVDYEMSTDNQKHILWGTRIIPQPSHNIMISSCSAPLSSVHPHLSPRPLLNRPKNSNFQGIVRNLIATGIPAQPPASTPWQAAARIRLRWWATAGRWRARRGSGAGRRRPPASSRCTAGHPRLPWRSSASTP